MQRWRDFFSVFRSAFLRLALFSWPRCEVALCETAIGFTMDVATGAMLGLGAFCSSIGKLRFHLIRMIGSRSKALAETA